MSSLKETLHATPFMGDPSQGQDVRKEAMPKACVGSPTMLERQLRLVQLSNGVFILYVNIKFKIMLVCS